jgi:hypothetical protein
MVVNFYLIKILQVLFGHNYLIVLGASQKPYEGLRNGLTLIGQHKTTNKTIFFLESVQMIKRSKLRIEKLLDTAQSTF